MAYSKSLSDLRLAICFCGYYLISFFYDNLFIFKSKNINKIAYLMLKCE